MKSKYFCVWLMGLAAPLLFTACSNGTIPGDGPASQSGSSLPSSSGSGGSGGSTSSGLNISLSLSGGLFSGSLSRSFPATFASDMLGVFSRMAVVQLTDGRVIALGGLDGAVIKATSSVSLYDPAGLSSSGWLSKSPMNVPRVGHSAAIMNGGLILVVGGETASTCYKSTEIYNPSSDTWTTGPEMLTEHAEHTHTPLGGGKFLIAGGVGKSNVLSTTSELYDADTNRFQQALGLLEARRSHSSVLLANGLVMVCGGMDRAAQALQTCETYDPLNLSVSWRSAKMMNEKRAMFTMTMLADGRVLAMGGYNNTVGALSSVEVYDPFSNTWSTSAPLTTARFLHTSTVLDSGEIMVAGGSVSAGVATNSVEIYDPTGTGSTGPAHVLSESRYNHGAVLLKDQSVLFFGGNYSASVYRGSTETQRCYTKIVVSVTGGDSHYRLTASTGSPPVVSGFFDSSKNFLPGCRIGDTTIAVADGAGHTAQASLKTKY